MVIDWHTMTEREFRAVQGMSKICAAIDILSHALEFEDDAVAKANLVATIGALKSVQERKRERVAVHAEAELMGCSDVIDLAGGFSPGVCAQCGDGPCIFHN